MADQNSAADPDLDLFGQPVKATRRGRGRPAHNRTRETVNRVILGLALNWSVGDVAKSIGITIPTLRQHYSSELRRRAAMRLMVQSVQLGRLNDQAEKGNVAAEKELMKALDRIRREQVAANFASTPPARKPEKLGKKEAALAAAKGAKGKYEPPPAPQLH